jgi:hypothetical protein
MKKTENTIIIKKAKNGFIVRDKEKELLVFTKSSDFYDMVLDSFDNMVESLELGEELSLTVITELNNDKLNP